MGLRIGVQTTSVFINTNRRDAKKGSSNKLLNMRQYQLLVGRSQSGNSIEHAVMLARATVFIARCEYG